MKSIPSVNLFSVRISIIKKEEALAIISLWLRQWGRKSLSSLNSHLSPPLPKIVVTPNPEMIVAAQTDHQFRELLNSADLAIADGWGLTAADRRLHRLSGLELMEALLDEASRQNWRVVLLGGKPGIARQAAAALQRQCQRSNSNIKGQMFSFAGPPDINRASKHQLDSLITTINQIEPHLLFVAFGHGKQERWANLYRRGLRVGVIMGVGGALDQLADPSLRPPRSLDQLGLGWLYRLGRQPRRWRRQLALVKFILMVFSQWRKNIII